MSASDTSDSRWIAHLLTVLSDKLDRALLTLNELKETVMGLAADIKALQQQVDTETTAVGALVTALSGLVKNGMTDQEVSDLKAAMVATAAHLTAIAATPANPVPTPTPQMVAAKKLAGVP